MSHNLEIELVGHTHSFGIEDLLRQFGASFTPVSPEKGTLLRAEFPELSTMTQLRSIVDPVSGQVRTEVIQEGVCLRSYLPHEAEALPVNREIKRQIWQAFRDLAQIHFPWGSLTGVHPTMIAKEFLARASAEASAQLLEEVYGLTRDKAALAVRTAQQELDLLAKVPERSLQVYVDVPFCPTRCSYCSFSLPEGCGTAARYEASYVAALITELQMRQSEQFDADGQRRKAKTLYIGGGTPATLSPQSLDLLLPRLLHAFDWEEDPEWTFEGGRPDVMTREVLERIRHYGFTKLCINPQTIHDATLKRVNRRHTHAQTTEVYETARSLGFDSINMDLIVGLEGEGIAEVMASVEALIALGADSITVHALALKRSSDLHAAYRAGQTKDAPELHQRDLKVERMIAEAHAMLEAHGYAPYYLYRQKNSVGGLENVGFAQPGHGSLYNVAMMSDRRAVLGFGTGASSKTFRAGRAVRQFNKRGIQEYMLHMRDLQS